MSTYFGIILGTYLITSITFSFLTISVTFLLTEEDLANSIDDSLLVLTPSFSSTIYVSPSIIVLFLITSYPLTIPITFPYNYYSPIILDSPIFYSTKL